jgi:hypothetical protein
MPEHRCTHDAGSYPSYFVLLIVLHDNKYLILLIARNFRVA